MQRQGTAEERSLGREQHFFAALRLCVSIFIFAAFLPPPPVAAQEQAVKSLLWGADEEGGKPYVFRADDDPTKRIGFEVDLAAALAVELHRPIEFKSYRFDSLIPGLNKGDFDFAMNGLEITPERALEVRFSRPYYVYRQQLVVRADEERFATIEGCIDRGGVIGTLEGAMAERLLDKRGAKKRTYQSPTEAYTDLVLRRTDAVFMDAMMAQYYAGPDKRLKNAGQPTDKGYYGIAFRRDDKELADAVDAALGRLMENGKLCALYRRWDLWNEDQKELMPERPVGEGESQRTAATGGAGWLYWQYLQLLGSGALITVLLTVLSFLLAITLGMPLALARMYGPGWVRFLTIVYIELFRGLPVMFILGFIYFGLPAVGQLCGVEVGHYLHPITAAVLGLGLNYAAYEAEVYRAGLGAIPVGQWEAAASLGMARALTFRRIILPQAVRQLLPPMTNDLISLFKDTSVASVITVAELNHEYLTLARSTPSVAVTLGLTTAALYLLMSVPLGYLSRRLEQLWSEPAT